MPDWVNVKMRIEGDSQIISQFVQDFVRDGDFDPDLAVETDDQFKEEVTCRTPWCIPDNFCVLLTIEHPVRITLYHQDELFCGIFVVENGDIIRDDRDSIVNILNGREVYYQEGQGWIYASSGHPVDERLYNDIEDFNPFEVDIDEDEDEDDDEDDERLASVEEEGLTSFEDEENILQCSICLLDQCQDPVTTPCNHMFCRACIVQQFAFSRRCPLCRSEI